MKPFGTMCLSAAVAAVSVGLCVGRASAAVFDEVPGDALAVFEVRNIDDLNTKWGKFADETGLSQAAPNSKDLEADIDKRIGGGQGINTASDFAAVMFQTGDAAPTMLMLVPVSDYKKFLTNFPAGQEDADGVTATKATDGSDAFVAHWGDYAAVGETKDLVAKKPQGLKLEGVAADELKNKDAIVYFNMDQVRSEELPKLKKNHDQIVDKIAARRPGMDPAMAKIGGGMLLSQAEEFITDAKTIVLDASVTSDGVSFGSVSDFLPDTPFEKLAAAMKGTDQPLLTGLPDKKYWLLIGEIVSPEFKQQFNTMIIDPLSKQLDPSDPNFKALTATIASTKAKMAAVDAAAVGVVTPTGTPGQDSMLQMVATVGGDSAAWKKASLDGFAASNDLSKNGDANAPVKMTFDIKPDATTVADVHLDQFTVKTDFTGTDRRAQQAQQMQGMVFGPNGISGYLGTVTDKVGLATLGIDDQSPLMADAIAEAKSGKDVASTAKTLQNISSKLPSPRMVEGFFYIDQLIGVGVHYAQSMGLGIRFQLPADVAPIGFALSGDGTQVRSDAIIPESLVKAIADGVNQLRNGGGGGGGGGAPLPGGGQGL